MQKIAGKPNPNEDLKSLIRLPLLVAFKSLHPSFRDRDHHPRLNLFEKALYLVGEAILILPTLLQ